MDSHDRLANRLKSEAMHRTGRVRREIAHRLVAPSLDGEDDEEDSDDEDDRAGTVWRGHRLSVTGLTLTVDDTTVYSVSKEGGIVRWDVETGAKTKYPRTPNVVVDPAKGGGGPMAPPRCGAAGLLCCAVAQDRNLLCTAGADKRVHVWDTRTMKHVQEFASHRGAVTSLAVREDTGQLFSVSEDRTLKVWSLDDMAYVDTLFGHQSEVVGVAPQRRERVVTVGRDRTCRFWKVAEDSQLIFRPSPGAGQLESCAFTSPDTWITGSDDGTVSLWSTTKKRAVISWNHVHGFGGQGGAPHGIVAPKFFDEDDVARCATSRARAQALCGVSAETNNAPEGVSNAGRWVNAVATSRGADLCASGSGDGAIRLWRASDEPGRQLAPLWCLPARGFVNALAVASSGRFVLAGMGQEPRGGRWARDAHAKNGLLMHRQARPVETSSRRASSANAYARRIRVESARVRRADRDRLRDDILVRRVFSLDRYGSILHVPMCRHSRRSSHRFTVRPPRTTARPSCVPPQRVSLCEKRSYGPSARGARASLRTRDGRIHSAA